VSVISNCRGRGTDSFRKRILAQSQPL